MCLGFPRNIPFWCFKYIRSDVSSNKFYKYFDYLEIATHGWKCTVHPSYKTEFTTKAKEMFISNAWHIIFRNFFLVWSISETCSRKKLNKAEKLNKKTPKSSKIWSFLRFVHSKCHSMIEISFNWKRLSIS